MHLSELLSTLQDVLFDWLAHGLSVYGGFMFSATTTSLYGGALSDTRGVPPAHDVDANIFAFSLGLLALALGWFLARAKSA
jgi:hypothetical protein